MTKYRISFIAALTLVIGGIHSPAAAQGAGTAPQCTQTLAQYGSAVEQLEAMAAKAQALAQQNPLYESDVQYYAAVLADAQRCVKALGPITTAAR